MFASVFALVIRKKYLKKEITVFIQFGAIDKNLINFRKEKLKEYPKKFFEYYRISVKRLLQLFTPSITFQYTKMRQSIPSEDLFYIMWSFFYFFSIIKSFSISFSCTTEIISEILIL